MAAGRAQLLVIRIDPSAYDGGCGNRKEGKSTGTSCRGDSQSSRLALTPSVGIPPKVITDSEGSAVTIQG